MIEVSVESIRVSLITQQRIVVLRETGSQRYMPIYIGPCEAESITMGLQGQDVGRPMTHDLLNGVIEQLGASVERIVINDLREDTFYAQVLIRANGREVEVDSRPSDAVALAVRAEVPIYVAEDVMERVGRLPSVQPGDETAETTEAPAEGDEPLEIFRDFVEGLDFEPTDDEGDGEG
jgi:bifunctional DNase/RNase